MKKRLLIAALGVCAGSFCLTAASAQTRAVVSGEVFLRAGPAPTYPAIVPMPVGTHLVIHGCTGSYAWCDVSWHDHRGWVSSPYIRFDAAGHEEVVTAGYATALDVAVVDFSYGYWQAYYVGMPWFGLWDSYYLAAPPPGGPHGGPGTPHSDPGGPHGAGPAPIMGGGGMGGMHGMYGFAHMGGGGFMHGGMHPRF